MLEDELPPDPPAGGSVYVAAFGRFEALPLPEFPMIIPMSRKNAPTTTSCQVLQLRRSLILSSPGAGPLGPGVKAVHVSPGVAVSVGVTSTRVGSTSEAWATIGPGVKRTNP